MNDRRQTSRLGFGIEVISPGATTLPLKLSKLGWLSKSTILLTLFCITLNLP
jgi:hypothetical protein